MNHNDNLIHEHDMHMFEQDMSEKNPWGDATPTEKEIEDMEQDYKKNIIHSKIDSRELASKLVDFAKDTDFYDYQDNLDIGETDEDAIENMVENLKNKDFCEGVISYITDYISDESINLNEAKAMDGISNADYMKSFSEHQNLLSTLIDYTDRLDSSLNVSVSDESIIDRVKDYVNKHPKNSFPNDDWFEKTKDMIQNKVDCIQGEFSAACIEADTVDERYYEIERRRQQEGYRGDEPNIPAYLAEELQFGKTLEDMRNESQELKTQAFDEMKSNLKSLAKEVNLADRTMYKAGYLSYSHLTLAGNDCDPEFIQELQNVNPVHPFVKDFETRKSPVVFDNMAESQKNKDLPWTDRNNRSFNNSIKSEYDRVKPLLVGKEDRKIFFDRVWTALDKDVNGVMPTINTDTIDYMDGYEDYQDMRISESLVHQVKDYKSSNRVDFSKSITSQKNISQKQDVVSMQTEQRADVSKRNDGRGRQKNVPGRFEAIISDGIGHNGHGDLGDN